MEKQDDLALMKVRSYRSVIAAGFKLYTENFRRLFKASWQMVLIYAVCCGAGGTLTSIQLPEMTMALMQQMVGTEPLPPEAVWRYGLMVIEVIGLAVLSVVTMGLASATILNKLKEHRETGAITTPPRWLTASPKLMWRTTKGIFLTLLVVAVPLLLFIGFLMLADTLSEQYTMRHLKTVAIAMSVFTIIVALLSLPLMHVLMKYLMEAPCGYWRTLGQNYGRGMRHWGALFVVFFVSTLLVTLATLVVMLPATILNMANQQAHSGLLIGDPLGMPTYIIPLTFVTFMLCSFIQFYMSQVTLVHNYYIYGSIETQETEREQQKISMQ
ncbi:MAG: hypothetical protein IJ637_02930 [Prevotella sp.]|nr:hypothetical protein [Prevotella sp.]